MPIQVMLVEDDDDIRLVLCQAMRHRFNVAEFADARSALEHLRNGDAPYQVAVVDLWMPGMDGLTLIEKMQADERLRRIAIIIITGIADRELPESFWTRNLGIAGFFHKPFHPEDLIRKIEDVVRAQIGLPPGDEAQGPRGGYL
ncbi:MAG: response regulator [Candidatus Sumerlaeia bacterium]